MCVGGGGGEGVRGGEGGGEEEYATFPLPHIGIITPFHDPDREECY